MFCTDTTNKLKIESGDVLTQILESQKLCHCN